MTKKTFGPQTWLYPMPAVLAGVTIGDTANFMTAAWCGIVAFKPPTLVVGIRRSRHTYQGMHQEFSINIPSTGMVKEVDYCGIISGKDVDKSKLFTISLISSRSLTEVTGAWASSLPKPFR
ncbi:MAG TPA: flavin reductase family protein [Thermodesulfobacteriota bacterium]|nr:flavin reductase family protein [Deltaproteobacteria bacterium]HNR11785.1 flavin reductase family protein [Thermodesulfobacteriota bacterium]HNU71123.1 flavin reductase family protein [Thermodesulfobacteriota bacterium]HQO78567.1 flavin reductase family protein [Thermodesulfobacteriota bacterium]